MSTKVGEVHPWPRATIEDKAEIRNADQLRKLISVETLTCTDRLDNTVHIYSLIIWSNYAETLFRIPSRRRRLAAS
jgi:hypothetical protein